MKKASVYLLRDNLATYLNEIKRTGVPLVVYKYKKPLVIIKPVRENEIKTDYEKFFGFMNKDKITGVEYENRLRRGEKEKKYMKKLKKLTEVKIFVDNNIIIDYTKGLGKDLPEILRKQDKGEVEIFVNPIIVAEFF